MKKTNGQQYETRNTDKPGIATEFVVKYIGPYLFVTTVLIMLIPEVPVIFLACISLLVYLIILSVLTIE